MDNNFKKDLEIAKRKDIKKLIQLSEILKNNTKRIYRGEVNIIDNNNKLLIQTHYEFFTLILDEKILLIQRYNNIDGIITLDYTNFISVDKITNYEISSTSLKLNGELSKGIKVNILAVFLDKKKNN